jgi:hypothetical protein
MKENKAMKIFIKKRDFFIFLSVFLYKVLLDFVYYFYISDIFNYMGYELSPNIFKIIESYLLLFVILFFIPKSKKLISNIIVWILVSLAYIPMLTIYALKNEERVFMFVATIFWLIVFWAKSFSFIPRFFSYLKQGRLLYFCIIILVFFLILFLFIKEFQPSISLNLKSEYEIRSQFSKTQNRLADYIFGWAAKIIIPFLFVYFIIKKKWLVSVVFFLFQVLIFSVTGHKFYFFVLFFCLILVFIAKTKNPMFWLMLGLCLVVLIDIFIYLTFGDLFFLSIFTRRTIFTSPLLAFNYYDFFSENPFISLSHHWPFRIFLEYPYSLDPADLIGEYYCGGGHANNGMMSDGYMNFGFAGMIIWAFLYSTIFKIIDFLSYQKNRDLALSILASFSLSFRSGGLLGHFLTEGLLLAFLLLYLLPPIKKNIKN